MGKRENRLKAVDRRLKGKGEKGKRRNGEDLRPEARG